MHSAQYTVAVKATISKLHVWMCTGSKLCITGRIPFLKRKPRTV